MKTFRMVFLAMMVAIGVVISPILRIEGMCPTAHLINITCSVFMGPWYSLLCACMIGVIRMMFMGIPPLALTGAVLVPFYPVCSTVPQKARSSVRYLVRSLEPESLVPWYPIQSWLFDGKRGTERVLLYPYVYFRYHYGRYCGLRISEGIKPDGNASKISRKSWCKSL